MIRLSTIKRLVIPPGPILVLTLIGLMFLSAVMYNRAVRVQRFLEPALALSQPRTMFHSHIQQLFIKEFGTANIEGIQNRGHSILVRNHLIFSAIHNPESSELLKRLGRVFLGALDEPKIRAYIDFITISPRVVLSADHEENRLNRLRVQSTAEVIQNALFAAEPLLEKNYSIYFESSAMSVYAKGDEMDWVEFRIIPSERLHIEVLMKLEKYVP